MENGNSPIPPLQTRRRRNDDSGLADFLIARAVRNPILGNRFYWYLMVEVSMEDKVMAKMYGRVVFKFMKILEVKSDVI